VEIVARAQEAFLTRFTGIAHEQFSKLSIVKHDNDTVFVDIIVGIGKKWHRWGEYIDRCAVTRCHSHAASRDDDRNRVGLGGAYAISICATPVLLSRIEEHADRHCIDNGPAAT